MTQGIQSATPLGITRGKTTPWSGHIIADAGVHPVHTRRKSRVSLGRADGAAGRRPTYFREPQGRPRKRRQQWHESAHARARSAPATGYRLPATGYRLTTRARTFRYGYAGLPGRYTPGLGGIRVREGADQGDRDSTAGQPEHPHRGPRDGIRNETRAGHPYPATAYLHRLLGEVATIGLPPRVSRLRGPGPGTRTYCRWAYVGSATHNAAISASRWSTADPQAQRHGAVSPATGRRRAV
jgi:hypothetical protein